MNSLPISQLTIPPGRQRREFPPSALAELMQSISVNGLMHPVVIRRIDGQATLVAGERRLTAMKQLWLIGEGVRCGGETFPPEVIPTIDFGELDPLAAFEMELDENIRRENLTWQERAKAESQLLELRKLQAEKAGTQTPTHLDIALETRGTKEGGTGEAVRQNIILSKHLDDPDIAKAKTANEAFKTLKRKEDASRRVELARAIGSSISNDLHTVYLGNCLSLFKPLPENHFDVILTDPPYGIDAQDFGDSGGKATGGSHFYDDSYINWKNLMLGFAKESIRVTKEQAHLYCFCDIDNFVELREIFRDVGWRVFRTPLIFVNPQANRLPWIEQGPQRKWQMCLFAVRGERKVIKISGDVLTYPNDTNLGHQAQKPIALYQDLLARSVNPGDHVLDPFAGSGPIIPAAHALKCRATAVEQDEAAYGIILERVAKLG